MLFGIIELSGPETVVIGAVVTLVECYWDQKKSVGLDEEILFNISTVTLAASGSLTWFYHSPRLLHTQEGAIMRTFGTGTDGVLSRKNDSNSVCSGDL